MSLIQDRTKDISTKNKEVYDVSRKQLLLTCVGIATSNNSKIKNTLISKLSEQLGDINQQDYQYMAEYIYRMSKDNARDVNNFLCKHLSGYTQQHNEYYAMYYAM